MGFKETNQHLYLSSVGLPLIASFKHGRDITSKETLNKETDCSGVEATLINYCTLVAGHKDAAEGKLDNHAQSLMFS